MQFIQGFSKIVALLTLIGKIRLFNSKTVSYSDDIKFNSRKNNGNSNGNSCNKKYRKKLTKLKIRNLVKSKKNY